MISVVLKNIFSLVVFLFSISFSYSYRFLEEPVVKVEKWIGSSNFDVWEEGGEWEFDFSYLPRGAIEIVDQGHTIIVSEHLAALAITCNASYPVEWTFQQAELSEEGVYEIAIKASRESEDVNDSRNDRFISTLELFGSSSKVTGNYTCRGLNQRHLETSVFVYWKGSSPPYLVQSGRTIHVKSPDNRTLILPCYVSQPEIDVQLLQEASNGNFQSISPGMGIRYDPRNGFIIDVRRYPNKNIYGRYKCVCKDDEDDEVNIIVERGTPPKFEVSNIMSPGTGLFYDSESEEIVCCAKNKPPSLRNIYCLHPSTCQMKIHELFKAGNNGKKNVNGSCISDKIFMREHSLLRCKGDGIDIIRTVYTNFENEQPHQVYFNWNEIQPEKMMHLTIHSEGPYYHKETIEVTCEGMNSYFADGHKWAIKWRNKSLTFVQPTEYEDDPKIHGVRKVEINLNWKMLELACYIPVWNSTNWVSKTVKLDVQKSTEPVIDGQLTEELSFTLNDTDKLLECKSIGKPLPTILWEKNGEHVPSDMVIFKENGVSVLMIHRVTHDSQAEYRCISKNYAGKAEKIFTVDVYDSSGSAWGTTAAVLVPILVVAFIVTAGALVWKMQIQKKVVDHLSRVVFRDADRHAET